MTALVVAAASELKPRSDMNDSEFDDLLKAAKGDFPLPPSFKQGVWQRIENASAPAAQTIYPSLFGRQWAAALGIAATVIAGLWLGAISAPETKNATVVYAESISPFAHAHRK